MSSIDIVHAARVLVSDVRYAQLNCVVVDFLDVLWREESFLDRLENLLSVLSTAPKTPIAVVTQDPYIAELADTIVRLGPGDLPPVQTFTDRKAVECWIAQHQPVVH